MVTVTVSVPKHLLTLSGLPPNYISLLGGDNDGNGYGDSPINTSLF